MHVMLFCKPVLLSLLGLAGVIGCNSLAGLDGIRFEDGQGGVTGVAGGGGSAGLGGSGGSGAAAGTGGSGGTGGLGGSAGAGGSQGSLYAQTVLADGPVAYWRLGETSGVTAYDASGNGIDLLYSGGHTLGVPGLLASDADTAVELDGATGLLQGPDELDFDGVAAFSAEAWVTIHALPTDEQLGLVGKRYVDGQGDQGWALRLSAAGHPELRVWRDDASHGVDGPDPLTVGIPHHVVGVFEAGVLRVFLNGVLIDSDTSANPSPIDTLGLLVLGRDPDDGYIDGVLDEVALYDKALAPQRIAAHFAAGQ